MAHKVVFLLTYFVFNFIFPYYINAIDSFSWKIVSCILFTSSHCRSLIINWKFKLIISWREYCDWVTVFQCHQYFIFILLSFFNLQRDFDWRIGDGRWSCPLPLPLPLQLSLTHSSLSFSILYSLEQSLFVHLLCTTGPPFLRILLFAVLTIRSRYLVYM